MCNQDQKHNLDTQVSDFGTPCDLKNASMKKESLLSLVDSTEVFNHIRSNQYDTETELRFREKRVQALIKKKCMLEREGLRLAGLNRLIYDSEFGSLENQNPNRLSNLLKCSQASSPFLEVMMDN